MIDIQAHILPALDDGPRDLEESVQLVKALAAQGVQQVVATPHFMSGTYQPSRPQVLSLLASLQARVPEVTLHPGAEVYLDDLAIVEQVIAGEGFTLGEHKRYVLVEFPLLGLPRCTEEAIFRLRAHGIVPIIAHPERNADLLRSPVRAQRLIELGALLQVNADSVLGGFGRGVRHLARRLVVEGWAHFLASDCHDLVRRPPRLREALQEVTGAWCVPWAERLVNQNPQAVLKGDPVEPSFLPAP